jgi:hypothetical protein
MSQFQHRATVHFRTRIGTIESETFMHDGKATHRDVLDHYRKYHPDLAVTEVDWGKGRDR